MLAHTLLSCYHVAIVDQSPVVHTFARHQGTATAIPRPLAVFLWSFEQAWRHSLTTPCQEDHAMAHGTVKWFNEQKGVGFITQESGPDVFVHYSAIDASGFESLTEGDEVEFEVTQGPKGPQAQAVKELTPAAR
jgi:cold shock protein